MARNIEDFWKLLDEIQGETTDLTDAIVSIAKNEKTVAERLFTNVIDQVSFTSADYQRIRSFLRDWYAAHRSLTTYQSNISDIYQIPNDQLDDLFQSFGYNYSTGIRDPISNNPSLNKINFFLDLVNLYKIKGSPRALVDVLQYYGIVDVDLYEMSLQFEDRIDKDPDDLIFKGRIISGTTGDTSPIYLPFDLLTQGDPHWLQTESQIRNLFNTQKINFPSQSPYFAVKPLFDEEATDAATGILQRKVQDQYDTWEAAGFPPEDTNPVLDQDAIISITGDQCSLLTVYLATIYTFNKEYEVGQPADRFVCYDGTNTSSTDIIEEFREVTAKPLSRSDLKTKYNEYLNTFSRPLSENFLQTHSDAGLVLSVLNPTVKANLDSLATDNNTVLGTLLKDLGEWVRANISYGFINMSYILFGIDSLFGDLREVVEFFKPYRARIVPLEMLQLRNRLLNSVVIEDSFSFDTELDIIDFLVGDSQVCCADATCSALYGPREYYDCGSYHDIGAVVSGMPDYVDTYIYQRISDHFRCPAIDTTGYVVSEILGGLSTFSPQHQMIPSGISEVHIIYDEEQDTANYSLVFNIFNEADSSPSIIPFTVINKTISGCTLKFSDTFSTDDYEITWDQTQIDGTNTAGIEAIPQDASSVVVTFMEPMLNVNYSISLSMENFTDSTTEHFLYTITSKDVNGFTVEFSDVMPTPNYRLAWTSYEYGRDPYGPTTPEDGVYDIPNGVSEFTIGFSLPYEWLDDYTIAASVVNVDDPTSSQYGFVIRSKDPFGFSVILSSPTDSGNYKFSWSVPVSASKGYEDFSFRQTGQMRDFDEEGTFDCTHGMDQVDIEVEEVINFMLQENGDYILQENGSKILL